MKKIFPILLCILLISVMAFSASAAGSSVALIPSETTLERGDTFTIVANLTNADAIKLGTVALDYDTNVFEMTGGACHVAGANPAVVLPAQKVGTFFLGAETVVSGKIFTFNFKVKADAAFGTYTFTPTAAIGVANGTQISASTTTITVACKHTFGNWTDAGDGKHSRICSKCQNVQAETHEWNDGTAKPAATCDTPGKIEYKCTFCAATKTEDVKALGHKFDNDCDATCNRSGCDYTRTASHKYAEAWSNDKNGHWHECSVCKDQKDYAKHTPGAAATDTSAQLCTVCKYEIAPALGHTHDMSTEWITDAQYHWHRCQKTNPSCYHVEDKAEHDYDNDCDVSCNTCAYIREAPHSYTGEWKAGTEGHWYICTSCGSKSQTYPHEPGPEATQDTPQTCTECNFVMKLPLSHVHEFGETWYGDAENHWQSCTDAACLETTEKQPHTWDEGTEQADGTLQYTCTVCGEVKVNEEPIPGPTEPNPSVPDSSAGNQNPEHENSGKFPWQWAGIAAVVLLVIGIVLLVIEFIRSRKVNSHGRFSK